MEILGLQSLGGYLLPKGLEPQQWIQQLEGDMAHAQFSEADRERLITIWNERHKQDTGHKITVLSEPTEFIPVTHWPVSRYRRISKRFYRIAIAVWAIYIAVGFTAGTSWATWQQWAFAALFIALQGICVLVASIARSEAKSLERKQNVEACITAPKPTSPYELARDMYVQTGKRKHLEDMVKLVVIEFPPDEVDYTI